MSRLALLRSLWIHLTAGMYSCRHVQEYVFTTVTGALKGLPFREDPVQSCISRSIGGPAGVAEASHHQRNGLIDAII